MDYNYVDAMVDDISTYISHNVDLSKYPDRNSLYEFLKDRLFLDPNITGNRFNPYSKDTDYERQTKLHIMDNWDLLCKALTEYGCYADAIDAGPGYCDTLIRCYLLNDAISRTLDEMKIF